MVRWLRWHCPPDTGFEIRALAVWGRARYLSVTEAPHNTNFHTWMGKKHFFVSFKPPRPGTEPRTLAWKAAVLTTTLGPPPSSKYRPIVNRQDLCKKHNFFKKTIAPPLPFTTGMIGFSHQRSDLEYIESNILLMVSKSYHGCIEWHIAISQYPNNGWRLKQLIMRKDVSAEIGGSESSVDTRHVEPMLAWGWPNVADGGPALNQHWFTVHGV